MNTAPLKGFRDIYPEDFQKFNYILTTWRSVCTRFGFEEYLAPVLENAEIYNKSGEDIGTSGKELYRFTDRGGRDVVMRPEMTPSVGRMVAAKNQALAKPLRWFSIANFFRAENTQRGRTREFWQLNFDLFGEANLLADVEILTMAIEIMLEFGAKKEMFTLKLNDRRLMDELLTKELGVATERKDELRRIIDTMEKNDDIWLSEKLAPFNLEAKQLRDLGRLSLSDLASFSEKGYLGATDLLEIVNSLTATGYGEYITFSPTLARGFDYYTGMVFEVFDNNPENNRALYGGGRYDELLSLFGVAQFPAVGCAPGDVATDLFLESWDLYPKEMSSAKTDIAIIYQSNNDACKNEALLLRQKLVRAGIRTILSLNDNQGLSDQMRIVLKKEPKYVCIIGEQELAANTVTLKNTETREQQSLKQEDLLELLKK